MRDRYGRWVWRLVRMHGRAMCHTRGKACTAQDLVEEARSADANANGMEATGVPPRQRAIRAKGAMLEAVRVYAHACEVRNCE